MSVLRQLNLLSQMRLDIPHLRALESSITADFDVLAGRVLTGGRPMVVRGFTLSQITPGTPATSIQMVVADAILMNIAASESGTFLWVPNTRTPELLDSALNPKVRGGFTAAQINYVGLDLIRSADPTTADLVQFLDADTLIESPKTVPLGRTLDYRIVISTTPFSAQPNIVPIAKVLTNANNQISTSGTDVTDSRPLLFRLGTGGDFPNRQASWGWAQGRNDYNNVNGTLIDKFQGGDKLFHSQKEWMDGVMSRLWEIGGGEQWYSPTADRNIRMTRQGAPAVFLNGDSFEVFPGSPQYLRWQGLRMMFENSNSTGIYFNTIADQLANVPGQNDLAPGECLYVDLDRTQNATLVPQKALIQQLGVPTIPGSRIVFAWCIAGVGSNPVMTRDSPYPVGSTGGNPATPTSLGIVQLSRAATTPLFPIVITDTGGTITPLITGTAGLIVIANPGGGTAAGITSVGNTTGAGVSGTGGATGVGLLGTGGASGAYGVEGVGTVNSAGVHGIGSAAAPTTGDRTRGAGVFGVGNTAGAYGLIGISGTAGTLGTYSSLNLGEGVVGIGRANSAGVMGIGGGTAGSGVSGVASDGGNGNGGFFTGAGSGHGSNNIGGATGHGVNATGGSTSGSGVNAIGGAGGGLGGSFTGTAGFAGLNGQGQGAAAGGTFTGGATGTGVTGSGGSTSGRGGTFTGTGGFAGAQGQGQGAGVGLHGIGGATGIGVTGIGGSTSGAGGSFTGTGGFAGIIALGQGAAAGGTFTGGATGVGLTATGGSTGGNGATLTGTGGGQGAVISGQGAGAGATIQGGATGVGLIVSQSVSHVADVVQVTNAFTGSFGINATSTAPNGAAIRGAYSGASTAWAIRGEADTAAGYSAIVGQNTGSGAGVIGVGSGTSILAVTGATGVGVVGIGSTTGGTYGGYFAAGATNSPGLRAIGNGSGYGIDAQSAQGSAVRGRAVGSGGYGGAFESQFGVGLKTQGTDAAPSTTTAIEVTGYMEFTSVSNPANGVGFTNILTAKNVCKAWFRGVTNASAGWTSRDSFNFGSPTINSNSIDFAFVNAMASGVYSVVCSVSFNSGTTYVFLLAPINTTTTGFSLTCQGRVTGGVLSNFSALSTTASVEVNVQVFAAQ